MSDQTGNSITFEQMRREALIAATQYANLHALYLEATAENETLHERVRELEERLPHEFARGMAHLSKFRAGCPVCNTMAWKVTASGGHRCDNCGNIFDPDYVPEPFV